MRLYSTPESVRAGEPSLLAIAETLAAITASVWIGVHFDTWMHVAIGACIAPFLLLRIEASCIYAVRHIDKILYWGVEAPRIHILSLPFFLWTIIVPVTAIRVWATFIHAISHPIIALGSIPVNWWRTVVVVDSATSPEWIPMPADIPEGLRLKEEDGQVYFVGRDMLSHVAFWQNESWNSKSFFIAAIKLILFGPALVTIAVSGLAYRWSIKSTALIWAPMLWALKPSKPAVRDWKTHLSIEADLKKPQLVAVWSTICLVLLVVKYTMWAGQFELAMNAEAWRDALRSWNVRVADSPLAEAVIAFVRPGAIPLWQVAVFFNSLLGLVVWWKIRDWLAHFKHGVPPADQSITRSLAVTFFFRHLLTSYVILCDGYIAIQLARKLPVPEIGSKLFPWL